MFEARYSKIDSFVFFVLCWVLAIPLGRGGARLLARAGYNSFFKFLLMLVCIGVGCEIGGLGRFDGEVVGACGEASVF